MMRKMLLTGGAIAAIGIGVLAGISGPSALSNDHFPDPDGAQTIRRDEAIVDQDCSVSTDSASRAMPAACPQQYAALMDLQQKGWCLRPDVAEGQSQRWIRCADDQPREDVVSAAGNAL